MLSGRPPPEGAGGAGVLSLGKLAPGQQQYYLDTVTAGADEYYTGGKEAPGEWIGAATPLLGLEGTVDADALGRVLAHVDPAGWSQKGSTLGECPLCHTPTIRSCSRFSHRQKR